LYDTVQTIYYRNDLDVPNAVSAQHQLNDPSVPLHHDISVRIKSNKKIPEELKNRIIIKRSDPRSTNIRKAEWQGDPATAEWLSAKFGEFGNFQAFIDTIPPQIKISGAGDTLDFRPDTSIIIEARDNFGPVKKFRAEIDGQWIRFTNDKGSPYIYNFDEQCSYGLHQLKVTVEDLIGNSTTKTWWFKRYPYTPPKKKIIHKKKTGHKKHIISKKNPIKK
jgi:hypothetical protein